MDPTAAAAVDAAAIQALSEALQPGSLQPVVGKVTVRKLLRYVTSYIFK